ncbi:MAG: urea ABC transporter substrate-binding protein [Isosphaeraceae bacterium]
MKRWLLVLGALLALGFGARYGWSVYRRVEAPIRVGILHSRTGPLEISERSMIDAEVMALEEINAAGGLLGRRVEWLVADGRSDPVVFAREARRLIEAEHVSVIFGCWASATRKSVRPVVEGARHLLFYPNAYEGLEQSPQIIYTGAAPNQQVIPAINWCRDVLKARRFFLVGSDYVWPHCVNAVVKDQLRALGAEVAGEFYVAFGTGADVGDAVDAIRAARPDVIISTVAGDANRPFYRGLKGAGIEPGRTPVVAFGIAEDELRALPVEDMVGDYAAWNYFQSIDRRTNREFVQRFKARHGAERVTSDAIVAAHNSVRLWAQAVEEAGTEQTREVQKVIGDQSLDAPEGIVTIDHETQHTWRPFYLGKIRQDGQFEIVWSLEKPIRPVPYPGSRSRAEWDAFVEGLYTSWGENWFNPRRNLAPSSPPAAQGPGGRREATRTPGVIGARRG